MNRSFQSSLESCAKIVSNNVLSLFAQNLTRKEYLDAVTSEIAKWIDCRCIGIRILDGDGYISYESSRGFSPQFLEKENRLSLENDACACIRVIKGEFAIPDQAAKTPQGSFNCKDSSRFISGLNDDEKALFRGTCIEAGFKSICIVPIRYRDKILGAIHLADKRKALISWETTEVIESIGFLVGEAVFRYGLEKAFADSEIQYNTLVENSPSGIYLVQNEKIIFANKAFADIYGYSQDEIIGLHSLNIVHPEDRGIVQEIRRKRLKGEEGPIEYEIRCINKNGDIIWVSRRNVLIEYNGKPSILGYEVDNTDYKNNNRILKINHELLETIFSNVHFMVAYMDADFNFIRVNRAYAEADGHTPEFYIGKNHFRLFPNPENEHIFREVVETGKPYFVYGKPFEYALRPERGTTYWDWSVQPIKNAEDRVAGVVLSLVDITERKQAEEDLKQAHADLEQQAAELSQRADQLSRLTSELTLAEQRERRRIAEILHDHLQQLMVGAKIGQETILGSIDPPLKPAAENVLDLINQSIQASRTLTAELSPMVLRSGDFSNAMEWLVRWVAEKQGFQVRLQIDSGIVLDRKDLTVLLFQSIRELLLNSVKHSGVSSAVITAKKKDRELCISVSDRGKGFDPETVWKGSNCPQKFGLISIRERLLHLGGLIELNSAPHAGTTVVLTVPLDEKKSIEKEPPALKEKPVKKPAFLPAASDKIRVMIVDDHAVMRQGLSAMLGLHSDIEIVGEAADGEKAVQMTREIIPDVILMDIKMPKMNGLKATRIIHREFPDIRIIGLSFFTEEEQGKEMMDAGAFAYRSKSDDTELLLAAIRGKIN